MRLLRVLKIESNRGVEADVDFLEGFVGFHARSILRRASLVKEFWGGA
jgi:hypothetical protein